MLDIQSKFDALRRFTNALEEEIAKKADRTRMEAALDTKADVEAVSRELDTRIDKKKVQEALTKKVSRTDFETEMDRIREHLQHAADSREVDKLFSSRPDLEYVVIFIILVFRLALFEKIDIYVSICSSSIDYHAVVCVFCFFCCWSITRLVLNHSLEFVSRQVTQMIEKRLNSVVADLRLEHSSQVCLFLLILCFPFFFFVQRWLIT